MCGRRRTGLSAGSGDAADAATYGSKRCGPSPYEVFEDRQAS